MTPDEPDLYQFNQQLDTLITSDKALNIALAGDDPLLRAAARLTHNRHPILSPTSRQTILGQLSHIPNTTAIIYPDFVAWFGRIAATLVVTLMIGFAAQPAAASSIPGDLLYPIKLNYEKLAIVFTRTPAAQVTRHLNQTQSRLNELEQLPATSRSINAVWQSAATHLSQASSIAIIHNIFDNNVVITEHAYATLYQFNSQLAQTTLNPDIQAQVNLAQTVISAHLAVNTITPLEPMALVNPEITPEVTEIAPEATEVIILPETTPEPLMMVVNAATQVNMRTANNTASDVISLVNPNTLVTIISYEPESGWYQVELADGTRGWILSDLLMTTDAASQNANGNSNGNANGNSNGNANGNSNGNSNGNANGNSNGNSNGNANGNSNGN
ncbi:MAG: SH3 domain-containing protein [Phototrophicaceae bacterium]